ncbi:MAG: sugar phosphate isomerase/epimerase [Clostridiales bacterium]|nr:sugar phosphate isomerase/epimerase [Clostridiales bacterium]
MNRVICSTGGLVVRANNRDFRQLRNILPAIRCDGVEFMLYGIWYDIVDELTAFLRDLPVNYPVLHAEKSIGEYLAREEFDEAKRRFIINCRLANDLGSTRMVLHLWNGMISDSNMPANLKGCGELMKIAADHGLAMMVENVVCNVQDPMTHLRELMEMYPDIGFTFDTKMAQFHRQMDELYNEKNADLIPHIRHLHINDIRCGYMDWANLKTLHIGEGDVDFDRFFDFIKKSGYRGDYTVEALTIAPDGTPLPEKMNRTLDYIREKIGT